MPSVWIYTYLTIIAQLPDSSSGGWDDALRIYGFAAPFLLFLLYVIYELRKDIKDRDTKIDTLTEALTDRVIPLVTESNALLRESADLLKEASKSNERTSMAADKLERIVSELGHRR